MSHSVSPINNSDGYIPTIEPVCVLDAQPAETNELSMCEEVNHNDSDTPINEPRNLLKQFNSLCEDTRHETLELGARIVELLNSLPEDTQHQTLELGARIIELQSRTLSRLEKQTERNFAALESLRQVTLASYAPGGPLDPVRLREEDEDIRRDEEYLEEINKRVEEQKQITERQKKEVEGQKKDLEEQKKVTERQKKEIEGHQKALEEFVKQGQKVDEEHQARLDRYKYILQLGWVQDGAQLVKGATHKILTCDIPLLMRRMNGVVQRNNNTKMMLKVGLVAGAIFFLQVTTNTY